MYKCSKCGNEQQAIGKCSKCGNEITESDKVTKSQEAKPADQGSPKSEVPASHSQM